MPTSPHSTAWHPQAAPATDDADDREAMAAALFGESDSEDEAPKKEEPKKKKKSMKDLDRARPMGDAKKKVFAQ